MSLELQIDKNPQFSPEMPKYSGHIKICNKQGDELWKKEIFSSQEAQEFIQKYGKTVQKPDWVKATILPIRTDNLNNFAKDLFLPTFVNQTLKIHNIGLRSFASFFAIILDVITFIPRLLTSPFKAFYDHYKKDPEHPLNSLLKKKVDQLDVQIYQEIIELKNDAEDNNIKYANKTAEKVHCWVTTKVIPGVETKNNSCEKYSVGYIGNNNEWVIEVGPSQKREAPQSVDELVQKLDLNVNEGLKEKIVKSPEELKSDQVTTDKIVEKDNFLEKNFMDTEVVLGLRLSNNSTISCTLREVLMAAEDRLSNEPDRDAILNNIKTRIETKEFQNDPKKYVEDFIKKTVPKNKNG